MASFLKRTADFPVAKTLAEQFAPCSYVADPAELDAMAEALSEADKQSIHFASWHEARQNPEALHERCVCFSRRRARSKSTALAAIRPDLTLHRLEYDVLALAILRRLCDADAAVDDIVPKSSAPSALTVICSAPRSGSYWLCELFELNGLGTPTEHLRPDVFLIRAKLPGFQILRLMNRIWRYGEFDDAFATKVIHKFVHDGFQGREASVLRRLAERMTVRVVYLYRRNLVAQALSSIAATQTQVWRARNDYESEHVEEAYPEYDFTTVKRFFKRAQEQAAALHAVMEDAARTTRAKVLPVCYEDLVEHTDATLRTIFSFIGRPVDAIVDETSQRKIAPEQAQVHEERFRGDYLKLEGGHIEDFKIATDSPLRRSEALSPAALEPPPKARFGIGSVLRFIKRITPRGVKARLAKELRGAHVRDVDASDILARQDALVDLLDQRIARLEAEFDARIARLERQARTEPARCDRRADDVQEREPDPGVDDGAPAAADRRR